MAEGYVKKCKIHVEGFRNKMNQPCNKVAGTLTYDKWKNLNDFYNNGLAVGEKKNLETINGNLAALYTDLANLSTKVDNCKSDIGNVSFSQDYVQLLKNAKMFDGSDQESNINSIMEDIKTLKSSIEELSGLCSNRKSELSDVREDSFRLISEICACQDELSKAYEVQTQKKNNDEREVVNEIEGTRYYFYLSEPGQPERPNKLSVERWWDFDPYQVSM